MRGNQGEGLVDRRCRAERGASKVDQHVFDHHDKPHFILDNENPPAGKQSIRHG